MSKHAIPLSIEYLPPGDLKPDPRNPRLHKPPQVAAIARSIETFGFVTPVLIDSDGTIISGRRSRRGRPEARPCRGAGYSGGSSQHPPARGLHDC
jgi:hypothetical protein